MVLDYIPLEPSDDEAEQLQAALKVLEKGSSAILIDPASEAVLLKLGDQASAADVPIIALNDERMTTGVLSAIAIHNEAAGRKAGEQLADLLGDRGVVAILRSDRRIRPHCPRRGAKSVLSGISGIQIADGAACGKREDACWQAASSRWTGNRLTGYWHSIFRPPWERQKKSQDGTFREDQDCHLRKRPEQPSTSAGWHPS